MAIVNGAKLTAAKTSCNALFQGAIAELNDDFVGPFVMDRTSDVEFEKYHFIDPVSAMEEFSGSREYQKLIAQAFIVQNKVYTHGVEIGVDEIADDRLDIVRPAITRLANSTQQNWNKLLAAKLIAGEVAGSTGYDDAIFFSAAHPSQVGAARSNTDAGSALTATTFAAGVLAMESLVNTQGDPIGISPTHLVVGPLLRATAEAIVEIGPLLVGGDGDPNPNYGRCKLVVNQYLGSSLDWYLFDNSHAEKAMIRQKRSAPIFSMDESPSAESVKQRRVVEAYAEVRGAIDYGMWEFAYKGQA